MSAIRIAIVGCGAVTKLSHLPALIGNDNYKLTCLIDLNEDEVFELASLHEVNSSTDYMQVLDQFDLAVVATPPSTHYQIVIDLLNAGKHVLEEKPVTTNFLQAEKMIALAKAEQRMLAVSLVRRFDLSFRFLKDLLDSKILGKIVSFDLEEGGVFNWPVQTEKFFNVEFIGGGVLMDHGAHILDACLWWFGEVNKLDYKDDSFGGVEADCNLQLEFESGVSGSITLSRLRNLKNRLFIQGEAASLSLNFANGELKLYPEAGSMNLVGTVESSSNEIVSTVDLFKIQYQSIYDGLKSIDNSGPKMVTAKDCLSAISLVEKCYINRKPYDGEAWSE